MGRIEKFAPPPPPARNGRCRWCDSRLLQLGGAVEGNPSVCPQDCAPADVAPYWGICSECEREFQTGRKRHGGLCWQCDQHEYAAMVRSERLPDASQSWKFSRAAMRERLGIVGNVDE